uniref:Mitochondrial carrier protein n=1 Tax=Wuchereria bancrofti TaxID=6293 RepID=A0AAF5PVR1_WUCBA
MDKEAFVHFLGGALGGTAGTAITCPLEVVKTRLQSAEYACTALSHSHSEGASKARIQLSHPHILLSHSGIRTSVNSPQKLQLCYVPPTCAVQRNVQLFAKPGLSVQQSRSIYTFFKQIVVNEGFSALFKGIGPNLIGVAPSKAVYFCTYSSCKRLLNSLDIFVSNSAMIHMSSAATSGFVAATVINPVWLVKTRLQLHKGPLSVTECIRRVWKADGFRGFYRGVTASYVGISETVIQFVLYEEMRALLLKWKSSSRELDIDNSKSLANPKTSIDKWVEKSHLEQDEKQLSVQMTLIENDNREMIDFLHFMLAGGTAKFFACSLAYPHEVVRTRMREENAVIKGFLPTLKFVWRREGFWALYRGLAVQLLRTVPNTAITMGTYELTVHVLHGFMR